jgi:O-antigen/teichoic acid export membrane protein
MNFSRPAEGAQGRSLSLEQPAEPQLSSVNMGLAWNIGSLGLMGIAGIVANLVVAWYYDASALGSLNQVVAIFMLAGQFGAFGTHLSAQRHLSQHLHDSAERAACLGGALVLLVSTGLLAAIGFGLLGPAIGWLVDSEPVAHGIVLAAPGLFFFVMNKLLLSAHNGLDWLRSYAILQAMRPILLVASLVAIAQAGRPPEDLPFALTVSEGIVCLVGWIRLWGRELAHVDWRRAFAWLPRHRSFGIRSALSNFLLELNTRVDILIVALFMSDAVVGVYSFAAILAEGFVQLPVVVRTVLHARTVRLLIAKDMDALYVLARRVRIRTYFGMAAVVAISVIAFPTLIPLIASTIEVDPAWQVFSILMIGLLLGSGYLPFANILLQGGMPGRHTLLMSALVIVNVIGNFALIPIWGINGAAAASALTFALVPLLIRFSAKRCLGVRL